MKCTTVIIQESQELSVQEQRTLEACEADIAKGIELQAKALQTIRDKRLYRSEFGTFEEYCRDKIGKSRHWANRQIQFVEICANIAESGLVPIGTKISESAAREISDLEPEQQAQVVVTATDNGKKPTAANVREAKKQIANTAVSDAFAELSGKKSTQAKPNKKTDPVVEKNPAKLVDELTTKFISPLVRGIDEVAEINGGKGYFWRVSSTSIDSLIKSLNKMREGKQ